jgi:two-component system chemotaxis response regulator CheB
MRKAISTIVQKDPEIKVVGLARNGEEAVSMVKELKPDILTLDIEMPILNGLEALRIIINECPLPVIMISSLTKEGAFETIKALELGAVDYIPKDITNTSLDILKIEKEIIEKIKSIARKKNSIRNELIRKNRENASNKHSLKYTISEFKNKKHIKIVAIGSSTGGPGALQQVITSLPDNLPCSIVIAQHMPVGFTKAFAERLDSISNIKVKEAEDKEILKDSTVYIAPGNKNMYLIKDLSKVFISLDDNNFGLLYKPSVDILITSVADIYGRNAAGVILTGMGCDGLNGIKKLKERGGYIIAQDEETSVIYGMPKAIVDSNLADKISPIDKVASEIISLF